MTLGGLITAYWSGAVTSCRTNNVLWKMTALKDRVPWEGVERNGMVQVSCQETLLILVINK